jgi:hypothetical protein
VLLNLVLKKLSNCFPQYRLVSSHRKKNLEVATHNIQPKLDTAKGMTGIATGRTRKHLGLHSIDPLCAACVCFPPSSTGAPVPLRACGRLMGGAPNRSGRTEPYISEERKLRARNGRLNFTLSIRLPRNRRGFLTCRKSTTRDPQLYFPSEGRHA